MKKIPYDGSIYVKNYLVFSVFWSSPLFRGHFSWDPFWWGSTLMKRNNYGNFEGFSLDNPLFGLVSYNDHCRLWWFQLPGNCPKISPPIAGTCLTGWCSCSLSVRYVMPAWRVWWWWWWWYVLFCHHIYIYNCSVSNRRFEISPYPGCIWISPQIIWITYLWLVPLAVQHVAHPAENIQPPTWTLLKHWS